MRHSICTAVHQLSNGDDCHDGQHNDNDDASGVDDDSYDEDDEEDE